MNETKTFIKVSRHRAITDIIAVFIIGFGFSAILFNLPIGESPKQAYERGKIDGRLADSTMPYVTMEIVSPGESEIVIQIVDDDTLYFSRQKVDTGYILTPIYRMRKLWTPEDSADTGWEEWFDTSRGWYGWDISEALARDWYDRAADTSHSVYEKAAIAWAMSYLLRERTFVIYFDSTDTMPVMEMEGVEMKRGKD